MASENGEVKEAGLQPVSVELPEDPLQGKTEVPPPFNASGRTAEAGDHGNGSGGDHQPGAAAGASLGPGAEKKEGTGEGETASLNDVVLGIMSQPRIIADGLKLKLQGKSTPLQSFSYALFPSMSKSSPVGWQYLVTEQEETENIRLHNLQGDDQLPQLLQDFKESYTKAVILINSEDNFTVSEALVSSVATPPLPLLIVKKTDGEEILRCLERHEGESVYAKVDAENQVDAGSRVEEEVDRHAASHAVADRKQSTEQSSISVWSRMRDKVKGQSKQVTELRTEIKRLMFVEKHPIVVSQNVAKFTLLMSAFHNYEKAAKREKHNDFSEVISKLRSHADTVVPRHPGTVFNMDFPFYILVIYRLHKKFNKYNCDETQSFLVTCLNDMERKLETKALANVLLSFTKQKDFNIMYNSESEEDKQCSAFHLLEQACLELAEVSYKVHISGIAEATTLPNGHRPLYKNFIYSRMLYISMAMKFHEARGASTTRNVRHKWKDLFTRYRHRIQFSTECLTELKHGLEVGRLLQLPTELACSYHHLGDLMASDSPVRPFHRLTNCLRIVEEFIPEPKDLTLMLTELRAVYDDYLRQPGNGKLKATSRDGTLTGCLTEGITFLDCVLSIMEKEQCDGKVITAEMQRWLELLLQLVDITGTNPDQHLRLFLMGKQQVTKKYRHISQKFIVSATQRKFSKLSIQQFSQLYKSFRIWSNQFLQDFLRDYTIPDDIKLSDPTWRLFFAEVVERFKSARLHYYLADFLEAVGQKYRETKRPAEFLMDLLKLDVDKLLSAEEEENKESLDVRHKFFKFLYNYITSNALKYILLKNMTAILSSISDKRDEFQQLVLDVLQRTVVPELRTISDKKLDENFKQLVTTTVRLLHNNLSWLTSLTAKQRFCWGILSTCCSKITLSPDNFDWVHHYSGIITSLQLSLVFSSYCTGKKLPTDQCIMVSHLPPDIQAHPSEDVRRYFEKIAEIQRVLKHWKDKFQRQEVTFKEIFAYASNHVQLLAVGESLYGSTLLVAFNDANNCKTIFLRDFELLNVYLLRYIPGKPELKWCPLPPLLEDYGVCLPHAVHEIILKKVSIPGMVGQVPEEQLTTMLFQSGTSGLFQPGHDISLRLHRSMTLKELSTIVQKIDIFQRPLTEYMEMLVFFRLHRSVLFDKYLRHHLKKVTEAQQGPKDTLSRMQFSDFKFSIAMPAASFAPLSVSKHGTTDLSVPMSNLVYALKATRELLLKIMLGTAKYSEIIADDENMLQRLEIEQEFAVLSEYVHVSRLSSDHGQGLDGVQSMLELFQYTTHIKNIRAVCQQYHLKSCLEDPLLTELTDIMVEHETQEDRSLLTPLKAAEKMRRVKGILCLEEKMSSRCLDVFAAMRDSAAFYQFVRDKQFFGRQGQAIFLQQYELITAQLQHEEYDEQVLNHLFAAFKVITPFMDSQKTFTALMTEVTALNAINGLKQLETVNTNITLIRLWFSRAEGDTLQNVAQELECIISTGSYTFNLGGEEIGEGRGQLLLEYEVAASAPVLVPTPAIPPTSVASPPLEKGQSQLEVVGRARKEKWTDEQIGDFLRKLGFMDSDRENEAQDKIKHFLHLSQTVSKLFELYLKLRELGHSAYLSEGCIPPIPCSSRKEEVDRMVQDTQQLVNAWTHEVSSLRDKFSWLLFFSVPKMLRVYELVTGSTPYLQGEEMVDHLLHEISFLAVANSTEIQKLRNGIRRVVADQSLLSIRNVKMSPMLVVGQFLSLLLQNHTLPRRCSVSKEQLHSLPRHIRSVSTSFSQPLYFCPSYSQSDFLCLILNLFNGIPESYQVLRCQATTTEEELSLFLKRVEKHRAQYLMLDVNKLSFKQQERLVQVHLAMQRDHTHPDMSVADTPSTIHFVETAPSMLREMPWIQLKDTKDYRLPLEEAKRLCMKVVVQSHDFACIQIVYGDAGNGKTHYIKQQLSNCSESITIALNEAFTPLGAITKLRSLPLYMKNIGLFFNFTILPPGESVADTEHARYRDLMEVIGWFFFDLFVLGYVEDTNTGLSFRMPGQLKWAIYIEVPSRGHESAGDALKQFHREVPALQLLGSPHYIHPEVPFLLDQDVQLVCKYLRAYEMGGRGIDREYREGHQLVKFSLDPDLSEEDCHRLLVKYMPKHIRATKITQQLFIRYMKRRCDFLDCLPAFNYNTGIGEYLKDDFGNMTQSNTKSLGSTLMHTMLSEVSDFCDPSIKENWSNKAHQQLIYDFKDGGASLGLISLHPSQIHEGEKAKFRKIGVTIPSMTDLYSRELLDSYLSRALNVELENDRLSVIDDSAYVLTLDYTIKMLNIHERYKCGVPVIIEGETGVGKTALVEMLSKLWNQSLLLEWKKQRSRLMEFLQRKLGDAPVDLVSDNYQACLTAVESMSSGDVSLESILFLCNQPDGTHGQLSTKLHEYLRPMRNDPVVPLLTLGPNHTHTLEQLFEEAEQGKTPETVARLLQAVLAAEVQPTFHKINVHAAMLPGEIRKLFRPVFKQAKLLQDTYKQKLERIRSEESMAAMKRRESITSRRSIMSTTSTTSSSEQEDTPFITVFLDEVNTSSCLGLFKEIIVDRSFDGEAIPENVFIVAACNPHRGNSLASHKTWVRGTYYVRSLHPTLKLLMWDYGSLDEHQERDYINAKMKMINKRMENPEIASLTDLIVTSQVKMRDFAFRQLRDSLKSKHPRDLELAHISSKSCVSQRDIQRVFTFYQWFKAMYDDFKPHGENRNDYHRRAVLVALGLVYYMRLNAEFRKEYSKYLDEINRLPNEVSFSTAFAEELDYYIKEVELPKGIARTLALKENLFATIICTVTHTPLIIVGAPGSSKTLSFNQTIANLKGQESKKSLFRNTDIFHSLDPHYYQCSRRTTSNEIQTVFSRAVNRQRSHLRFNLPIFCVVFMDEAGLPEESHESLKVLHYHLDKQEVSFVAITNHVLDAAKTNRAVSLFRPEASDEDLETLAKGCLCSNPDNPPPELRRDLDTVVKLCQPYSECMKSSRFSSFFGLRDFIQFINYLRRKRDEGASLSPQLIMQALERNFNGSEEFDSICAKFLKVIGARLEELEPHRRQILEVLQASMKDRPQAMQDLTENEVRYKLIIDPSEDDSLVRLLFSIGVLDRENSRMFVCSDFPGDGELQQIHTIAAIRHSAIEGHTAVLSQTDDIHESFYDLFNQRFRRIDDPEQGPRYYTNIAIGAHLKPSRVHPNFQCVVVVKKSEVAATPHPFLNRFEKYLISHGSLLDTMLSSLPPCLAIMIRAARDKVNEFVCQVFGFKSLYGLRPETLDSLVLDFLPPLGHTYVKLGEDSLVDDSNEVPIYLLQEILNALRGNAGFHIPRYPMDELMQDTAHIFNLIVCDPKYEGILQSLKHEEAMQAVAEAFNLLHTAPGPKGGVQEEAGQLDLTPEGCMIVSLLQQVLVRLLTKRLMSLMTTEAVVLNRNKIPYSYLEHYLSNQAHFSLKEAITNCHASFQATSKDSSKSPNKLMCFTRSSPLVHALPPQFPSATPTELLQDLDTVRMAVSTLVFQETDKLMVHKLSSLVSQSSVRELLREFVSSETAEVCVLLANMQETSKKTINHIRVMIEEEELRTQPQQCKVFVLVLHFPPAQFFQHCYPALFLKGWDHCYLDTLAHSTLKGVVDIHDWFFKCCFPPVEEPGSEQPEADTLLAALQEMLNHAISVLSARVYFGNKEDGSFNSKMNATQRSEALRVLLHTKGLGEILCEKFRAYWKPKMMAEYLEKAAMFTKQRESTLNITDSIQTQVKTLFTDFCVLMLARANENYNLDIAYAEDVESPTHKLFLDIFRVLPVPKLGQVTLLSNNLPALQPPVHCPQFPFFSHVYTLMEREVELSGETANLQLDLLDERVGGAAEGGGVPLDSLAQKPHPPSNPENKLQTLVKAVLEHLDPLLLESPPQVLSLALQAMTSYQDLWQAYFNDFITHKLNLVDQDHTLQRDHTPKGGDMAQQILHTYFEQLHFLEMPSRLAQLHCHVSTYQLYLAQMATILRPLSKICKLQQGPHLLSPSADTPTPSSQSAEQLLNAVRLSQHPLGTPAHLSSFVISTLFNALVGATTALPHSPSSLRSFSSTPSTPRTPNTPHTPSTPGTPALPHSKLTIWFKTFRDIMSLPTLKQYIYYSLCMREAVAMERDMGEQLEAMMNCMQAVFVCLLSGPCLDRDLLLKGQKTFHTLFARHFQEDMQLKPGCGPPGLGGVAEVVVEVVSASIFSSHLHRSNTAVRLVLEGLLSHYFSPFRPHYHREDVLWFLRLANEQGQWCYNPFLGRDPREEDVAAVEMSEGVVAGGLEEDLMMKLEISTRLTRQSQSPPVTTPELPPGPIEQSVFKFHLGYILGSYVEQPGTDQSESGPLLLYRPEFRSLIGDVLADAEDLGPPGPYLPLFYQAMLSEFAESGRMKQPLCHLYFLTVLEHLTSQYSHQHSSNLSLLLRSANSIQTQLNTSDRGGAILLWVELQAVVQVLIQQVGLHLDPSMPHRLGDVQLVMKDVNSLLDNPALGGVEAAAHGMVLSLHLVKLLKSSRKFTDLLTCKFDSLQIINCLRPIHDQLQTPSDLKPHLFPFLRPGAEGGVAVLYQRVVGAMMGIHEGTQEPTELLTIAHSCMGESVVPGMKNTFRMVVWLAAYYDFFDKKVSSPLLCRVMGGPEMTNCLREEGYIRLIQCFLHPKLMLERPEAPNSLTERQVMELGPDGRPRLLEREGAGPQMDPVYQLFMPENPEDIDQSDVDLRHSLANLVAVVLGSPSRSNHLWFHLFAADRLEDTYITGFMYDSTISPEKLLYDCGVELSPEGQFGRQDYKKHACRGTYTLHSLYLLLWANFASFCMALLTQPDSDQRLHGHVISEWLALRHYCVSQLRTLWMHLRNNLGLSDEQRAFFVMQAMNRLLQVLTESRGPPSLARQDAMVPDALRGVFKTRAELDSYERMWHTKVYQPTWDQQAISFVEFSNQHQHKLFNDIRHLAMRYPHFPSEQELTHCILSTGDLQQHSQGGKLWLLSRFAMEWPRLQRGGVLLPELVELYQWLNGNIAHLLTYDQASSVTIGQVISLAQKNLGREMGEHVRALYEKVKSNYNQYVELIGGAIGAGACAAVRQGNRIFTIADDIPLLHFLTDVEEEEQGNDWLYVVIADIITNHNHTIENLYSMVQANRNTPLTRLLSDEPSKIFPTEVSISNAIVSNFTELHGVNSFLHLLRSRYQPTSQDTPMLACSALVSLSFGTPHPRQQLPTFHLQQLEEDLVLTYITGKPLIESPALLRKVFKFKKEAAQIVGVAQDIGCLDLEDMSERLPVNYKVPLPSPLLKRLEYEFHSANYHLLLEVVTALRTVVSHLLKALEERRTDYGDLENETAPEFMLNLYEHLTKHTEVLYEIGVQSASPSHLRCLADLPLTATYSCLNLFFRWVNEGFYDFSTLPFPFKVHLSYPDQQYLEQLRMRWPSTVEQLRTELQQLVDVLKHSEQDITKRVDEAVNKPILDYLVEYHMLEDTDLMTSYLPRTIMLHHYVEFRLSLRRLLLKVEQELEGSEEGRGPGDLWVEFIADLWQTHLPHLREEIYGDGMFVYNANTGCYGFQEEDEEEGSEGSGGALMAALLREVEGGAKGEAKGEMDSGSFKILQPEEESFAIVTEDMIGHTYDLAQSSSDEGEELDDLIIKEEEEEEGGDVSGAVGGAGEASALPEDLAERLKTDLDLQRRVISMVKSIGNTESVVSVESLARRLTPDDVADFLTRIQLPQYTESFRTSEISGELLLEAEPEILEELGVASPLHQMKIMQLFRRELEGSVVRYSQDHVAQFLQKYKLEKYVPALEEHGIDGDMVLQVDERLMKSVLREVGVASLVDNLKIRTKYKTFVSDQK